MANQPRRIPSEEQIVLAIAAIGEDATVERVTQLQSYIAAPQATTVAAGWTLAGLTSAMDRARLVIEGRLGDAQARLREASSRVQGGAAVEGLVLEAIRHHTHVSLYGWALEMLPGPSTAPIRCGTLPSPETVESLAHDIAEARELFSSRAAEVVIALAEGDLSRAMMPRVGDEALAELATRVDGLGQLLDTVPDPVRNAASLRASYVTGKDIIIDLNGVRSTGTVLGDINAQGEIAVQVERHIYDIHESMVLAYDGQERVQQSDAAPAPRKTEMPVGTETRGGGTNHPGRPEREGQLAVFQSPYARDALLVDIGETDRYGDLRWVALSDRDPRYQQAIANALEQKTAGVTSPAAGQGSQRETDDGFPYLERRKAGVVLLHARAGHQEFLIPQGVNESEWLEQTAVHDRREAENLIERARQLTERAGYAEMAAALCKPATPEAEQNASSASPDL